MIGVQGRKFNFLNFDLLPATETLCFHVCSQNSAWFDKETILVNHLPVVAERMDLTAVFVAKRGFSSNKDENISKLLPKYQCQPDIFAESELSHWHFKRQPHKMVKHTRIVCVCLTIL